jgi:uncharacterized repeat protein (TIGR01451 family)
MRSSTFRVRFFTIIALAALLGSAKAQVFIPTTAERQALNTLIPGIVDGAGIMDTLNSAIAQLDSATVNCTINDTIQEDTLEFIGFRYLDSLRYLSLRLNMPIFSSNFSLNGLPSDLNYLGVNMDCDIPPSPQLILNDLPASLKSLYVYGYINNTVTIINAMPDSMDYVSFFGSEPFWNGMPYIDQLHLSWQHVPNPANDFVFPPVTTNYFNIYDDGLFGGTMNLSQVVAENVWVVSGASNSQLDITAWPNVMASLHIDGSMWFSTPCIPWLPDGLTDFTLIYLHPFCMPNWPASLTNCQINNNPVEPTDLVYCSVLESSCPGANPGISGRVFIDLDGNGQFEPGEPPLPQASVLVQPNGYVVGCMPDGTWEVGVQPGNYTVVPCSTYPYYQSFTPAQHTADLPEMGDVDTLNDFAVTLIPGIQDLHANLYAAPARPGFNNRLYLSCRNYGTVPVDAQLVLNYGADQSWVGSSVTPSSQGANSASWNLGSLSVGSTAFFTVDLYTGSTVALGTPLNYQLTALPTLGDETPGDNLVMPPDSVVGSFDPNDKRVSPAAMSPSEIQANDKPLTYTVRFQNTGTYPAQRVVIVDTLPDGLQTASIQFLAGSHGYHWYVDHGVLYVLFENINLPDSTSDAGNSQGFVSFSLLPDSDLTIGTTIINMAHIVFDYNTPITTPPAVFHVQLATSVNEAIGDAVRVYPNPAQDRLWVSTTSQSHALNYVIKDLLGRDLLYGRLRNDGAVDIAALPVGSYTITTFDQLGAHTSHFVKL